MNFVDFNCSNIIQIIICSSVYHIAVYNTINGYTVYRQFSTNIIYDCTKDPVYSRIIFSGRKSSKGYISKFYINSLSSHPDYQSSTLVMNTQSSGSYNISSSSGCSFGSATSYPVTAPSYSNLSVTYQSSSADYFFIHVNTTTDSILYLVENTTVQTSIDFSCSSAAANNTYTTTNLPSWATFYSSNNSLSFIVPNVTSTTDYSFYVNTAVSGLTTFQKLVNLRVNDCSLQNCKQCKTNDYTTCIECNSGYTFYYNTCYSTELSTESAASSVGTKVAASMSAAMIATSYLTGTSSPSGIWSVVNQLQLFFLLLLIGVQLPKEVIDSIIQSKITLFSFDFIPFQQISFLQDIINWFWKDQNDQMLSKIGLTSGSSIVNQFNLLIIVFSAVCTHLFILCLFKLCNNCKPTGEKCSLFTKCCKKIIIYVYFIFTFGYYIRLTLQASQQILISTTSEIKNFNDGSVSSILSFIFCCLMLTFFACFFTLIITLALTSYSNSDEKEHSKLGDTVIKNIIFNTKIIIKLSLNFTFHTKIS